MSNLSSLVVTAVFALVALTACNKTNPNFCEGSAEECGGVDAPDIDAPTPCSGNGPDPACGPANPVCENNACTGQCTADPDCVNRPAGQDVCHVGSGDCVTCDEDDRQATPGSDEDDCPDAGMAVCDAMTHTCRACEAHAECASGVCDAGRCAPDGEVVYLDINNSDDNNACTRASPCLTVQRGVDVVRADQVTLKYLRLAPSATAYEARANTDRVDLNDVDVFIVGTGATVERDGNAEVFDIHGSSVVTIDGLTIQSGRTMAGHAIKCETATVTLRDATLTMNAGLGISGSSCTLTMLRSTVSSNAQGGVNLSGSTIKISRSSITGNPGGGVQLSSGSFEIVNNFVTGNGNLVTAGFAGLKLTGDAASKLEFNTVSLNSAPSPLVDGVECIAPTVTARNNIIVGSTGRIHVGGTCLHSYTLFTPDGLFAGEMNRVVDPISLYNFVSGTDYHIGSGSTAAGAAQTTNLVGESQFDVDGQPRNASGGMVDIGADEIP